MYKFGFHPVATGLRHGVGLFRSTAGAVARHVQVHPA